MKVKYKEYEGTLLSLKKEFCYKTMSGQEYNSLSLSIQVGSNVVVDVAGASENDVVLESKRTSFWKTENDPHEKNGLCLISWKSKSNADFMVDMAWWYDGKWEGVASINPPDFWAYIPNPEAENQEANRET